MVELQLLWEGVRSERREDPGFTGHRPMPSPIELLASFETKLTVGK